MSVAYFDCFSGIAGDMILGAFIDLGLDVDFLKEEIKKIGITGYKIDVKKIERNHIAATDVYITVDEEQQHHRSFKDIKKLIDESTLDRRVKETSKKIFQRLAEAEGKIHNIPVDDVHFHEVGAVDSIVDISGAIVGLYSLNIREVFCSALPLGNGFVKCAHGMLPAPAPATVELLKGVPVYQTDVDHELVTPTGAAFISTVASSFGNMPPMRIKKIGYGAGKLKNKSLGLLRVFLGELDR